MNLIHSIILVIVFALPANAQNGLFDPAHEGLAQTEQKVQIRLDELQNELAEIRMLNAALIEALNAQAETIKDLRTRIAALEAELAQCQAGALITWPTRFNVFHDITSNVLEGEVLAAKDVTVIPVFGHVHGLDPDHIGKVDVDVLRSKIPIKLPDADYAGPVCLDMEGFYARGITAGLGSPEWANAIEQMVLAAETLRELRPNVKIGYWGVPFAMIVGWRDGQPVRWWDSPQYARYIRGMRIALAETPLVAQIDWFTPCLYDSYPVQDRPDWDAAAVDGAEFMASICRAIKPESPILFSICLRTEGCRLLSDEELIDDQIRPSLTFGDGIAWWNQDESDYKGGKIPAEEIQPGLPWKQAWSEHFLPLRRAQYGSLRAMIGLPRGLDESHAE